MASDGESASSTGSVPKKYGEFSMKTVNFVAKNPVPSKYIIISSDIDQQLKFLEELIKDAEANSNSDQENCFLPTKPGVLISVTGGAQDFAMHYSKLDQVFSRGLLRAAQTISAWIVDGGTDAGVMQHVGKAIKDMAVKDVPYIGIATHKMVIDNKKLSDGGNDNKPVDYATLVANTPEQCALSANHTHFILVDTPDKGWGQEILFRNSFEAKIRDDFDIPVVLIVVNGGPGTLETVAQAVSEKFATVVVQGSGRASDAIAALVKRAQKAKESGRLEEIQKERQENPNGDTLTASLMKINDDGVDISAWNNFLKEAKENQEKIRHWLTYMDKILADYQEVTLFNADDEACADMDIFILRAILGSTGKKLKFEQKLTWGVVWNRDDIVAEILENEKGVGISIEEKRLAINQAFELSIQLNRPTIFRVLVENGAEVDKVNLQKLYFYKPIKRNFTRLPAHAKTKTETTESVPAKKPVSQRNFTVPYSKSTLNLNLIKEVFRQAGRTFEKYFETFEKKFIVNGNIPESSPRQVSLGSPRPVSLSIESKGQVRTVSQNGPGSPSGVVGKRKAINGTESQPEIVSLGVSEDTEENKNSETNSNEPSGTENKNSETSSNESKYTVDYTDILIWAVFVNRMDLAKVIWQQTTLPVHSALLACQLYRYLSRCSPNEDEYIENARWFEFEAMKMMDIFEYSDIKNVLEWKWKEMGKRNALEIAQDARCKSFIGHAHIQSWLDENFYSDEYGKVEPTIATVQIWMAIIMPLLIYTIYEPNGPNKKKSKLKIRKSSTGSNDATENPPNPKNNGKTENPSVQILHFYRLPIVKFWTNTFFYCGFLFVQAWILCTLDQHDQFYPPEILLWLWVLSLIVEEVNQYINNRLDHFKYLSNWMDAGILLLHVIYIALRWESHWVDQKYYHDQYYLAAVNTLIIATIFSWGRLLNAFAINDSLGPLYFIIIRLFKDIFLWVFVFAIFAVSFQLGFVNITKQANANPLTTYPDGTFPISYFTIIGDFSYAAPILQGTPLGIALLAIYALLAQIILVNLLIAMMGATYSTVSSNSAEEWKFYRLELMMENRSASFHPPPTNLVIRPIEFIISHWKCISIPRINAAAKVHSEEEEQLVEQQHPSHDQGNSDKARNANYGSINDEAKNKQPGVDKEKIKKKMKQTRDEVIEAENKAEKTSTENGVSILIEKLRTLANERENDRTFMEKKFKDLEALFAEQVQINRQLAKLLPALQEKEDVEEKLFSKREQATISLARGEQGEGGLTEHGIRASGSSGGNMN